MAPASIMILCDTNILIEFYKNNQPVTDELRTLGAANLAISVVTAAELYYGAFDKSELRKIQKHLALLRQYSLTTTISDKFLELLETFALSHKLSLPDALIAATALTHELPLYTLNLKDFHYIPDLKLYQV